MTHDSSETFNIMGSEDFVHYRPENPLIVQSDHTILLEVAHPSFPEVRDQLMAFAELVKSPEYVHTYRVTPLSIWNAAAAGMSSESMIQCLKRWSKFDLPPSIVKEIKAQVRRYGLVRIEKKHDSLVLTSVDTPLLHDLTREPSLKPFIAEPSAEDSVTILPEARGKIKQQLLKLGYPVEDLAGYADGERLAIQFKETTHLRPYQQKAVDTFHREGSVSGGSGVLVLPCGAGKTLIGLGAMERVGNATLILTPNTTSVRQWMREIREKTDVPAEWVGEYTGLEKQVKPITVATYQILTHRDAEDGHFTHLKLFAERDWGLIIYDEVHLLPAPVFRATASIQAKRRLGLTATLVREDGREEDVFSLVGPKKMDVPWKVLERDGWIAGAECWEIRTPLPYERRRDYVRASAKQKYRIASENPRKIGVLKRILSRHTHSQVIVIGQYLTQLREIAAEINAPLITGQVPQHKRDELYRQFQQGVLPVLVVSKVANFAIDLPDASVAVQLSGTFGSRQEEAQRLGRILRPKNGDNRAYFYTVVTRDTKDQAYALNRQRFLVEQGYRYTIMDAEEMDEWVESS